jgi:hypothetical protein
VQPCSARKPESPKARKPAVHPARKPAVPFAAFLLFVAALLPAAEAVLDLPDPLIPNVQMTGELRVTGAASAVVNITFPSIPGMTIDVPDEGGSEQIIVVNGKRTVTRGIPLLVLARNLGPTRIPPITIRMQDGTSVQTREIEVRVEHGNPNLTGEAYAEARFEPEAVVPGEPAKLVYRIYLVRGQVETLGLEPPSGSISLGERTVARGRSYDKDGRQWSVFTITWPFTLATPGTYEATGQQDYQVSVGDGFFDTRVLRGRVAIRPATLTVKALPAEGRPDDFTGLIGPLTLTAELDRPRIAAGEGVELRLIAAGRQVDLLKAPVLALPSGVQAYPKEDGKAPDRSTRIFRFDLVPTTAGELAVPAVSIPYFDPEAKVYRRAESRVVTLTVVPGRTRDLGITGAPPAAVPPAGAATPAAQPAAPGTNAPLKQLPPPLRGEASQPPSPRMPLLVGSACLALGGLLAVVRMLLARRPAAHRGRALAGALRLGDLTAAAVALASLRPSLTTESQLAAASSLELAIDRARFGGQSLPDPATWVAELEKLP